MTELNGVDDLFSSAPFIGIRRHRLLTDGEGITTLVAFHGCPLSCRYCLNPQCKSKGGIWMYYTPRQLYNRMKIDDIYFQSTGGGIVFGGGEPLLYSDFIKEFSKLCGDDSWTISVETSLNVEHRILSDLSSVISSYIVDIKDMNPSIYKTYTGLDNRRVVENLHNLIQMGLADKAFIRIPYINGYNTEDDIEKSLSTLREMGFSHFERIKYITSSRKKKVNHTIRPVGKAICEVLKQLRSRIADANDIDYIPHECKHAGDCLGTCPLCDYELQLLTDELYAKKARGTSINL